MSGVHLVEITSAVWFAEAADANATWMLLAVAVLFALLGLLMRWLWQDRQPLHAWLIEQRRAAEERAEDLLRAHVTDDQYRQLCGQGHLDIPSQLYPERIYRIPRHRGRVWVYECDMVPPDPNSLRKIGELCVIACDPVPDADMVLTHKWMIEADERQYLNIANWIGGHRWRP